MKFSNMLKGRVWLDEVVKMSQWYQMTPKVFLYHTALNYHVNLQQ